MLKRFAFCVLFTINVSILLLAQSNDRYIPVTKFDPNRNPVQDLREAVAEAKFTNKRIILDVGGDWCVWCHRLDAFMETNEEIKNFVEKNYMMLKVNFSKENKNEKFLSHYPAIEGYPHFFVLEKDGKLLHSQNTGELEKDKDYDKDKFMEFLKKWAP